MGIGLTAQTKSELKVLVIAHNPAKEYTKKYSGPRPSSRKKELANKRGEEYKDLLEQYFKTVEIVNSDTYKSFMSDNYDVTIMDDLPIAIDTLDLGMYRNGKSIMRGSRPMMYPRYLPEDFDRALIVIGDMTDDLTYVIPSKFLTQCHCIDFAYGYNTKTSHSIFNEPLKVDLKFVKQRTPHNFKKYYSGSNLPDEIDVWWAQTESSGDKKGYWVGQILTGLGFDDSPDCEFISSSNSLKDISGMALGRNGNMFHWGFSASPAFMTEQAKKVFVNTIHYMAQFNGKKTITNYKANSRLWANEFCYKKTNQHLNLEQAYTPTGNARIDSTYLYYKNNYPYFYGEGMSSRFKVDEDAKSLGIANNDLKILKACIKLLAKGEEKDKALRLLYRYTEFDYTTAKEWKKWFKTYKDYLFFTELGGYKFKIDTYNHPDLEIKPNKKEEAEAPSVVDVVSNKEDDIVEMSAKLLSENDNTYVLELKLSMKEGWHIYAEMPDDGMFIKTKISIQIPEGLRKSNSLIKPKSHKYEALEGVTLYKGDAIFKQELIIDKAKLSGEQIICSVYYQACNDYMCKPPVERQIKLSVKL